MSALRLPMKFMLSMFTLCGLGFSAVPELPERVFHPDQYAEAVKAAAEAALPLAVYRIFNSIEEHYRNGQGAADRRSSYNRIIANSKTLSEFAVVIFYSGHSGLDEFDSNHIYFQMSPPVLTAVQHMEKGFYDNQFEPTRMVSNEPTCIVFTDTEMNRVYLALNEILPGTLSGSTADGIQSRLRRSGECMFGDPATFQERDIRLYYAEKIKRGPPGHERFSSRGFLRVDLEFPEEWSPPAQTRTAFALEELPENMTLNMSPNYRPVNQFTDFSPGSVRYMLYVRRAAGLKPEEWTSADARSLTAVFHSLEGEDLTLKGPNGRGIQLKLDRLSAESAVRARERAHQFPILAVD